MTIYGDLSIQECIFGSVCVICTTVIFVTIVINERRGKK